MYICVCAWEGGEREGYRDVGDEGYSFVPRPSLPLVHVIGVAWE